MKACGRLGHGYADYFGLGDKGPAFWSLIITRVYQRTKGSLLLSILIHASISSSALIFGQQYTTISEEIIWNAISVGIALLAAILIWLGSRHVRM